MKPGGTVPGVCAAAGPQNPVRGGIYARGGAAAEGRQ